MASAAAAPAIVRIRHCGSQGFALSGKRGGHAKAQRSSPEKPAIIGCAANGRKVGFSPCRHNAQRPAMSSFRAPCLHHGCRPSSSSIPSRCSTGSSSMTPTCLTGRSAAGQRGVALDLHGRMRPEFDPVAGDGLRRAVAGARRRPRTGRVRTYAREVTPRAARRQAPACFAATPTTRNSSTWPSAGRPTLLTRDKALLKLARRAAAPPSCALYAGRWNMRRLHDALGGWRRAR